MQMTVQKLFPTFVYTTRLNGAAALNRRLLPECRQLERDDESGRRWSAKNYPGGYTSYNSASRMYEVSPTFAQLKRGLDRHVASFAKSLEFDLEGRELQMTDCWVNIMPRQVVHSLHLHPLATISGTYYVHTPRGSAGLKLEDPRLDRYMAAPPLKVNARVDRQRWVVTPAQAGTLVLFESWLRHEVPPNPASSPRVSVSFNYNWF
jgi:uncharacterized protein (TIGR02466 family)